MEERQTLPPVEVQQLVPQGSGDVLLTPTTRVLCIHRGRNLTEAGALIVQAPRRGEPRLHATRQPNTAYVGDLTDTFDGRHYVIAPGYFEVELGAAVHFKDRAVVPGSRNPETAFQASFIAIVGVVASTHDGYRILKPVDMPEEWAPFTDEECQAYEIAFEALDRDNMVNPIDGGGVTLVDTSQRLHGGKPKSRVKSGGKSGAARSGRRTPEIETTNDEILQPIPEGRNRTLQEIEADRIAAATAKGGD